MVSHECHAYMCDICFFFFKQKTAYEMRISDWSSDVCSSDLLIGGSVGTVMAKRVEMTKMPELVAFMHSMIGLAAVFIAIAAVVEPQSLGIVEQMGYAIPVGNRLELFLGAAIGAITFSGSVIAFGKLSGKYKFRLFTGAPVVFKDQHMVTLEDRTSVVWGKRME